MNSRLTQPMLFVAADRREAEPWVARWDELRALPLPVHWARAGKWRGRDMVAIANGVGAQRAIAGIHAAQSAADGFSGICSIGTGGGLDPALAISDIVVATAVTDGDQTWPALALPVIDPHGPPSRSGLVLSRPRIARTSEEKKNLHKTGAILVEMEAAAIANIARELAVPFLCVRVVSDLADETFFIDFERFLMPNGQFNVSRLVMYALTHPRKGLAELLRLRRRTSEAAKKLGGFLANCSF